MHINIITTFFIGHPHFHPIPVCPEFYLETCSLFKQIFYGMCKFTSYVAHVATSCSKLVTHATTIVTSIIFHACDLHHKCSMHYYDQICRSHMFTQPIHYNSLKLKEWSANVSPRSTKCYQVTKGRLSTEINYRHLLNAVLWRSNLHHNIANPLYAIGTLLG